MNKEIVLNRSFSSHLFVVGFFPPHKKKVVYFSLFSISAFALNLILVSFVFTPIQNPWSSEKGRFACERMCILAVHLECWCVLVGLCLFWFVWGGVLILFCLGLLCGLFVYFWFCFFLKNLLFLLSLFWLELLQFSYISQCCSCQYQSNFKYIFPI